MSSDTGIVHQQGNAGIVTQFFLQSSKLLGITQIGCQHFHIAGGVSSNVAGHLIQAVMITGDNDQVVSHARQSTGVNSTNAGGCTSDDGSAFT